MKNEKNQQSSFFSELGCFMKPYQGKYILSVLLSVLSVAAGIGAYAFAGIIVSMVFHTATVWSQVLCLVCAVVVCKLINTVLLNLSTWISHKAAYLTLRDIRTALAEKMLCLPVGYFETNGSGRLKSLMVDHVEEMEKTLAHVLPELTANLLAPLCCVVWMFFIDWRLALLAAVWIMGGFLVTFGMMKGYAEKYAGQLKAFKGMNQAVIEYVNGMEVIKNFGRVNECSEKYENAVYGHAAYNVNWQKETQKYASFGMAIAPFSVFPILIGGMFFFGQGSLKPETLFFMVILSFGIFGPLMNAMNYFDQLAAMDVNAKEIRDILDHPELERGDGAELKDFTITYEHVGFSYTQGERRVLNDISFQVPQGTMFALVGPSGSGKSTIAKLLAGFWDADSGTIKVGKQPIGAFTQAQHSRLISYVDQETFLFDISILDNIRIGCPQASREAVIEVAKKAGCHEFISALPDGYDTLAGSCGSRLSGGERQRIAIVRAMMMDAPIMVLDEATASTDPENEALIQKAITAAAKGKTLIVIAHRLATIVNADQIAYVEHGEIKALGTHCELMADCAPYRAMWELSEEGNND